MNAMLLSLAVLLAAEGGEVEKAATPQTRIYVRTLPPGARVELDGKSLGKSDGLFLVPPGVKRLTIEMEGFDPEARRVVVKDGEITRVEVTLTKTANPGQDSLPTGRSGPAIVLGRGEAVVHGYGDGTSEGMRSLGGSGHAVKYNRAEQSANIDTVVAVDIFAGRYGDPEPPREDFHVFLLGEGGRVLRDVGVPYSKIKRTGGDLQWYTLDVPPTKVPTEFMVALSFNPHQTKGIYLGYDSDVKASHSYTGLPAKGFSAVSEKYDWMVRVHLKRAADTPASPPGGFVLQPPATAPPAVQPSAPDVFATPPPDPKAQAEGQRILAKMIEANRPWLVGPPESVKSYAFRYKLAEEPVKEYAVADATKARAALLSGTTYYSPLHAIADDPESVTFRLVQTTSETITLEYALAEPIDAAYGNGVEGQWYGYFQRQLGGGTLVLDAKTLTPRAHRLQGVQEQFSEYVPLEKGTYVPRRIEIAGDVLQFDWRFAVYEPGLWILKEGQWQATDSKEKKTVATVEVTKINDTEPRPREPKADSGEDSLRSHGDAEDSKSPRPWGEG